MLIRLAKGFLILFVCVFCTQFAVVTHANEIPHLNIGRILIDNQSPAAQTRAGKAAFEQVLVKLSGSKDVLQNELLSRSSNNFQQYLVSSSFVTVQGELVYQASFAQDKLLSLLKFSNMPVWGKLRPKTTVWLAVQAPDSQQISIVNQISNHPWLSLINTTAYARGIELLVPVGDLDDQMNVSKYDIWGLFAPTIANYSQKFGNEYTLVARLGLGFDELSSKEAFIGEWTVVGNNKIYSAKSAGSNEEKAVEQLLSDYADYLASQHAISSELLAVSQTIEIEVTGIDSLNKYASALNALAGMAIVSSASVKTQSKESIIFELLVNADEQTLQSVLALDNRFRQFESASLLKSTSMKYEWVGR